MQCVSLPSLRTHLRPSRPETTPCGGLPLLPHRRSFLTTRSPSRLLRVRAEDPSANSNNENIVGTEKKPAVPSTALSARQRSSSSSSSTSIGRSVEQKEGPSADLPVIFSRLTALATPYWQESPDARWRLGGVLALTLATTGVSVLFSFLGRDFFNALSAKDQVKFTEMLFKWLGALLLGIPVFVLRDYYQSRLALDWREWMTKKFTQEYFENQTFYQVQAGALLDNPDQRIAVDVRNFTDTTLNFGVTILNAAVDLVSFSGILFSIYPPLFAALVIYSVGGTAASLAIGRPLVGLNFAQEAAEANFRYGLVRVRENAESIAFYGGEENEARLLGRRLKSAIENFGDLLIASRNLNFFTSFYRFLIQILPAAVVAPLFFRGEIEFGVVNQSSSAFNHILTDVSLVVYQFEALAGFSAVVDRLGELNEVFTTCKEEEEEGEEKEELNITINSSGVATNMFSAASPSTPNEAKEQSTAAPLRSPLTNSRSNGVSLFNTLPTPTSPLLSLHNLSLRVPGNASNTTLIQKLSLSVDPGHSLLIMGPSGTGKNFFITYCSWIMEIWFRFN
ncbi:hypothetical protein Ndes2526A_g00174 [Nannochloris sp. 'desiccata']